MRHSGTFRSLIHQNSAGVRALDLDLGNINLSLIDAIGDKIHAGGDVNILEDESTEMLT